MEPVRKATSEFGVGSRASLEHAGVKTREFQLLKLGLEWDTFDMPPLLAPKGRIGPVSWKGEEGWARRT